MDGIPIMKLQEPKIIYVDVDGTICKNLELPNFSDSPKDYTKAEPYPNRIKEKNLLYDQGHRIVYWTARGVHSGGNLTELTKQQLLEWGCKYHDLQVGNKPHFNMYICDKSYNSESFFHYKESGLP